MARAIGTAVFLFLAAAIFYASDFWIFRLWPREGLFGIAPLRPQGDLLQPVLQGTPFAPFNLLIFGVVMFLLLSLLQAIWARFFR